MPTRNRISIELEGSIFKGEWELQVTPRGLRIFVVSPLGTRTVDRISVTPREAAESALMELAREHFADHDTKERQQLSEALAFALHVYLSFFQPLFDPDSREISVLKEYFPKLSQQTVLAFHAKECGKKPTLRSFLQFVRFDGAFRRSLSTRRPRLVHFFWTLPKVGPNAIDKMVKAAWRKRESSKLDGDA